MRGERDSQALGWHGGRDPGPGGAAGARGRQSQGECGGSRGGARGRDPGGTPRLWVRRGGARGWGTRRDTAPRLWPSLQAGGFLLPSRRSLLTNLFIWGKLSVRNFRSNCPGQNRLFEKGKSAAGEAEQWAAARRRGRRTKGGLIGALAACAAGRPIDWAPSPTFHKLQTKVNFSFRRRGRGCGPGSPRAPSRALASGERGAQGRGQPSAGRHRRVT